MFTHDEFEFYWQHWSKLEEANYTVAKKTSGKEIRKYLKKGYTHFDHRFWFPERKDEIKLILQNGLRIKNTFNDKVRWWSFAPFLKVLIKTPRYKYQDSNDEYDLETKVRPISFAAHIDSLIFGFYSFALTKIYEKYLAENGFSDCVLAYRSNLSGKCNIQFSKEIFEEVRRRKTCTAIALDIKGYFDHIDHTILKDQLARVIGEKLPEDQFKLYKALTKYSYVSKPSILKKYGIILKKLNQPPQTLLELIPGKKDFEKFDRLRLDKLIVSNDKVNKNTKRMAGIPQGTGMSALLSNIYLIDFDADLNDKAKKEGFLYRRYCDDIIVICDSEKAIELQSYIIKKIQSEYFLTIQDKKVELTEFRENKVGKIRAFNKKRMLKDNIENVTKEQEHIYYKSLQYLGFEFNGQDIFIRTSSLSRYYRKMTGRIIKTVMMAYSPKSNSNKIWKEQMLHRYTHLGKRNFLKYAYNSSKASYKNSAGELKEGMDSPAIRNQISRHFQIFIRTLEAKNMQRFSSKAMAGKATKIKKI
ncbi:MAG: group II intron reverse transcriptase domain-containing protein [Bacteroidetes bacterium]|nr:group II intron reverse transcriptase domain-containing protein [Bacteroidota bacterium]